ncbi:MAG: flagellar basal-body MS-ring/collar protein FliF [Lachnospiraceae bacterium]|nr:flagellar basal-body MS-ring/collar protein FliF [Lachnospiraceae bacterium]
MVDKLKEIPKKILEWWNKFTSKQKTIIISVAAGVIVAFAILITLLTRPQYELLVTCESTKESSEIIDLLEGASPAYTYKTSNDGYQIYVLKDDISQARILLGANNIPSDAYDLSNVTSGGFSTTESDKQKMYKLYLESQMETDLKRLENVKNATVQFTIPQDDGTLISQKEDSSAAIMIEPEGEFTQDNAATVAQFVRTALGNEEIKNITIIDSSGTLLFSGDESYSITGSATSQLSVKQQTESILQGEVKKVLLGTNEFDLIEVSSNLSLDFSTTKKVQHDYTPAENQTQGVLSHEDIYSAESTGGTTGVPGTDSNGENGTTYVIQNGENSSSTVTEESRDYLPNETITETSIPAGLIKYDESSLSVAAIKLRVIRQEEAKEQGLLDGVSWEEYKAANSERTKIEADEDLVDMVAKASGISAENISFVAYEEPMFIDKESVNIEAADIIQILLIVVILGLLAFVIIRGMRSEKAQEVEEELSVESLLQSTPETELENIELETKSETRKLIEKFVDDNPEAAASLLRNWLNEDWG